MSTTNTKTMTLSIIESFKNIMGENLKSKYSKKLLDLLEERQEDLEIGISEIIESGLKKAAKKQKKKKKKKDPEAPKKPWSSYLFFCKETRKQIKEENQDIKSQDILKEMGKRWKLIETQDRKKYQELSRKDKIRFEREMENYVPISSEEEEEEEEKKNIKKPSSSYIFFCKEERIKLKEDDPELSSKEIMKELGRRWKNCSPEDKNHYIDLAVKDKERYALEIERDEEID